VLAYRISESPDPDRRLQTEWDLCKKYHFWKSTKSCVGSSVFLHITPVWHRLIPMMLSHLSTRNISPAMLQYRMKADQALFSHVFLTEVAGVTFSDSDSVPVPQFSNPDPRSNFFQIRESDPCSNSGKHRCNRHSATSVLKKPHLWRPRRLLLLLKIKI